MSSVYMQLMFDNNLCWDVKAEQKCPFTNWPLSGLIERQDGNPKPYLVATVRRGGPVELGDGVTAWKQLSQSGIVANNTVVQFFKMQPVAMEMTLQHRVREFTHVATVVNNAGLAEIEQVVAGFDHDVPECLIPGSTCESEVQGLVAVGNRIRAYVIEDSQSQFESSRGAGIDLYLDSQNGLRHL